MASQIFVETETPDGPVYTLELVVSGIWYNIIYLLFDCRLGWYEFGARSFVLQETYGTLLYIVLVASFAALELFFSGSAHFYFLDAVIFNVYYLRRKKEMVA
ncbi:hypothetical protein YB2330_002993 [Saitoella coloradoensis]